ncbi:unnamed protein product [Rotaria magnacalcarata]|uniref:LTD domain-containing protein n=2 Tax=Rotaria magnacalcarata TaxID=392030 RepID=A0A815VSA4_9BILA|nr:unnamed protein product [Rotaria magnacalcarata]CAF1600132.1 unnamed protein product [Rotaria magnacalcarata]CAF2090313.1 unnamed protein product [Rotaria magnacalcarata]CAF3940704.1 unnamed protein product [Rotaria magnacalcarata]CAF3980334.1 unnamed protein product [Rotaria magnacalcarata]
MSNSTRDSNNYGSVSAKPQQLDDSTVIRRTLVERGIRPVDDGNSSNNKGSTVAAIAAMNQQHKDEKRDLQDLNAKFATYLDRVQFLEDCNQRLTAELLNLKQNWGGDIDQLHSTYGSQLQTLRCDLDQAINDQTLQELKLKRNDVDIYQLQEQIAAIDPNYDEYHLNKLKQELDLSLLTVEQLKSQADKSFIDLGRLKNLMDHSLQDVNSLKNELDNQQLEHIMIANELQTLKEHIAFQCSVYQVQRADMLSLNTPVIDVSAFYRTELAHAISDIRRDFEILFQTQTSELESYYEVKTEQVRGEIETENERKRLLAFEGAIEVMDPLVLSSSIRDSQNELFTLQSDNKNLQAELDAIIDDLEKIQNEQLDERESYEREIVLIRQVIEDKQNTISSILDNNVSLRFEMSTYRGLLLAEEHHINRMAQEPQAQNFSSGSSLLPSDGISTLVLTSSTVPPSRVSTLAPGLSSTLTSGVSTSVLPSRGVSALVSESSSTSPYGVTTTVTRSSSSSTSTPSNVFGLTTGLSAAVPIGITTTTTTATEPTSTTPSTISILATGSPLTVTSGGSTLASGSPTTLPSDEILTSVYQDKATPNLLRHASATKKMTVQKIARGPISLDLVDLENDSVVLVNERYSGNEQSLQNWSIHRQIDQQPEIVYQFPSEYSLKPRQTVRIFSKRGSQLTSSVSNGLVADKIDTWSIGQHMITRLIDDHNEEKAVLTQIFQ